MRTKCLAQEHNTMTRPGLEPGPLDPESSVLTTRPPHLPRIYNTVAIIVYTLVINRVSGWGQLRLKGLGHSILA